MDSINDILQYGIDSIPGKDPEIVLDPAMPKIYDCDEGDDLSGFAKIFGQLFGEVLTHGAGRCRVVTKLDGNNQLLFVDHEGTINEDDLARLNAELAKISEGERWEQGRSGNKTTAERLKAFGGTMRLERIQDETGYRVRTLITIPIPKDMLKNILRAAISVFWLQTSHRSSPYLT